MKLFFKTQNAIFKFDQKEVRKQIVLKKSAYDTDEVNKLLNLISADSEESIVISNEPAYFEYIVLDLIAAGKGSVLCKTCNKTYEARQLKPIMLDIRPPYLRQTCCHMNMTLTPNAQDGCNI